MRRWWNTIQELELLRREMDDLFHVLDEGWLDMPSLEYSFLPGVSAQTYPLVNIAEDKENVYVEALAPGINPETLEVSVLNNTVKIAGEKSAVKDVKPEAFHRNERGAGRFIRTLSLPVEVNADKVKAEYKDGVLLLTLPKAESAKPKQIAISVS